MYYVETETINKFYSQTILVWFKNIVYLTLNKNPGINFFLLGHLTCVIQYLLSLVLELNFRFSRSNVCVKCSSWCNCSGILKLLGRFPLFSALYCFCLRLPSCAGWSSTTSPKLLLGQPASSWFLFLLYSWRLPSTSIGPWWHISTKSLCQVSESWSYWRSR